MSPRQSSGGCSVIWRVLEAFLTACILGGDFDPPLCVLYAPILNMELTPVAILSVLVINNLLVRARETVLWARSHASQWFDC